MTTPAIDFANFTPLASFGGGALIGLSTAIYLLCSGRIAGVSGVFHRALEIMKPSGKDYPLKLSFVSSMILSGTVAAQSGLFQVSTDLGGVASLVVGGLLVGSGARLQHGCTSGHGVCGLSRKSTKSLVLVCTFMAVGALTATFIRPLMPFFFLPAVAPTAPVAEFILPVLSGIGLLYSFVSDRANIKRPAVGSICGILFGVGLMLGGMADPQKVVGFLNISSKWDPSLAFVMAGAICVVAWPFHKAQSYVKDNKDPESSKTPCLFPSEKFTEFTYLLPSSWSGHKDKAKSLIGATLFGAGWAISGMCPGPGLVLGGCGSLGALLYVPCVLAGQWIVRFLEPLVSKA
jgi:uncharacterized protein